MINRKKTVSFHRNNFKYSLIDQRLFEIEFGNGFYSAILKPSTFLLV